MGHLLARARNSRLRLQRLILVNCSNRGGLSAALQLPCLKSPLQCGFVGHSAAVLVLWRNRCPPSPINVFGRKTITKASLRPSTYLRNLYILFSCAIFLGAFVLRVTQHAFPVRIAHGQFFFATAEEFFKGENIFQTPWNAFLVCMGHGKVLFANAEEFFCRRKIYFRHLEKWGFQIQLITLLFSQ